MWDFIKEKIPLSLVVAYLVLEFLSYLYFSVFLQDFGVDLLNIFTVSDLALIWLKNTYVFALIVVVMGFIVFFAYAMSERSSSGVTVYIFLVFILPFLLGLFLRWTAHADAHYIKTGEKKFLTSLDRNPEASVILKNGSVVENVYPVTNAANYFVFFSRQAGNLHLIRRDDVVRLIVRVENAPASKK